MDTKTIALIGCAAIGITVAAVVMTRQSTPATVQQTRATDEKAAPVPSTSPGVGAPTPVAQTSAARSATHQPAPSDHPAPTVASTKQQSKTANPQTARRGKAGGAAGQTANNVAPPADKAPERVALSLV